MEPNARETMLNCGSMHVASEIMDVFRLMRSRTTNNMLSVPHAELKDLDMDYDATQLTARSAFGYMMRDGRAGGGGGELERALRCRQAPPPATFQTIKPSTKAAAARMTICGHPKWLAPPAGCTSTTGRGIAPVPGGPMARMPPVAGPELNAGGDTAPGPPGTGAIPPVVSPPGTGGTAPLVGPPGAESVPGVAKCGFRFSHRKIHGFCQSLM